MTAESASSKNWELTLYELHRKPQDPITDGTVIAVSPRSLKSELMCPICLDILKVTMTTKECLHRFCSECIITALRSGNKECPTCRKKLVSKRSLRRDPNFDALIAKVYPSRQEYEAHQDKILARLNRQHLSAALTRSLEQQLGFLTNNRSRNSVNGRPNSTLPPSEFHTENAISEEEIAPNFGAINNDSSSRRVSHINSDTESGMDTNSVGEASSASDLPIRSMTNSNVILIGSHETNSQCINTTVNDTASTLSTASDHVIHHRNVLQGNVIPGNGSSVTSPSIFPEIEVLLKPHPKYCQPTTSSPTMPTNRNGLLNSVANNNSNNNVSYQEQAVCLVKYLKAPTITTVDHLCRYLTVRVNLQRMQREVSDDSVNFTLYSFDDRTNSYCLLSSHMSIEEISRTLCNGSNCLDLYYTRDDDINDT